MTAAVDADAYRDLFVSEARELLDILEDGLTRSISEDTDHEALFRAAHSLKGMSATLGHDAEARLAHALEDHLGRLATGNGMGVQELLDAVEALRRSVEAIALGTPTPDLEPFIQRLRVTPDGQADAPAHPQDPEQVQQPPARADGPTQKEDTSNDGPNGPSKQSATDTTRPATTGYVPPSVRVDAACLDTILDRTASLRIAQGRLEHLLDQSLGERPGYSLSEALENLERATHTLYAQALQLRTLPASVVTGPLLRRARQTAHRHQKEVRLVVDGESTHLDRSLLDALGDPLVHLLTNAVVHGIEDPEARVQAGKPREGTVHVRLRLEGNLLHVVVQDDGQGIDLDTVRERAVQEGHIDAEQADRLDPQDIVSLVTRPGFTTTTRLSEEAGRGVGLDAVAHAVHRVGGQLHLETETGTGTTITLTLPPTLSLIEVIPLTIGSNAYALPADAVDKVVHLRQSDLETGQLRLATRHSSDEAPVHVLRLDEVLGVDSAPQTYPVEEGEQAPIVQQAKRIKHATEHRERATNGAVDPRRRYRFVKRELDPTQGTDGPAGLLVHHDGEAIVFAVDSCGPPEQAIVKPLHLPTGTPRGATGAIVMRDGRVAIVLDPQGIHTEPPSGKPKKRARTPP